MTFTTTTTINASDLEGAIKEQGTNGNGIKPKATTAAKSRKSAKSARTASALPVNVPAVRNHFVVTDEFKMLLGVTSQLISQDRMANTLLLGPAGCGKTSTAEQLAAHLELPYLHINCSSIREASQLFGTREVEDGRTLHRPSLFTAVVESGNAVIMLDEINRCSPAALNGLLSVLDGSAVWVEDLGRQLKAAPGLVFIGACNIGAAYTGTFRLDKALDDRFSRRIEVSYLPKEQEAELLVAETGIDPIAAERLVRIATGVRHEFAQGKTYSGDISTRVLLSAAADFAAMEAIQPGSGPQSLKLTMANRFSDVGSGNSERSALALLIDGQFGSWGS